MKAGTGSLGERFSQERDSPSNQVGQGLVLVYGRGPCLWQGVGVRWDLRTLPTQPILFLVLVAALPQQSWVFRKENRQKEQTTNS